MPPLSPREHTCHSLVDVGRHDVLDANAVKLKGTAVRKAVAVKHVAATKGKNLHPRRCGAAADAAAVAVGQVDEVQRGVQGPATWRVVAHNTTYLTSARAVQNQQSTAGDDPPATSGRVC